MRLKVSTFHRLILIALPIVLGGAVVGLIHSLGAAAQRSASQVGTAFTYQGYLTDGGGPADGPFDFVFTLHDDPAGGIQVGRTIPVGDLVVDEGHFSVELDFEQGVGPVLDGTALWLGIQVRPGSETGSYTTLAPRQPLSPAPYAVYAARSEWSGLAGVPAGLDDGDDDTTYSAGLGLSLTGTTFAITSTYRLPQTCASGQLAQWDGAGWSCDPDDDTLATLVCESGQIAKWNGSAWFCGQDDTGGGGGGDGDITAVYSGFGLKGGRDIGDVTLSVTTDTVQSRVGDSCPPGSAVQSIGQDGTVTCEPDDDTIYSAGAGLVLSDTTLAISETYRLPQTCSTGQLAQWDGGGWSCDPDDDTLAELGCETGQIPEWNGAAWTCDPDDDTTYSAGPGLVLTDTTLAIGSTHRLPQTCSSGQLPQWDGSRWICDPDDDTLAELGCETGEIPKWNGIFWACQQDNIGSDGAGDITGVYSGDGLTGGGPSGEITLTVAFGGAGTASTVARSDHDHDQDYYTQSQLATSGGGSVVHWDNLDQVPLGLDDGDDDLLSSLSCADGQILEGSGGGWACNPDDDTLAELGCALGQVPEWNGSAWSCDPDDDTIYSAGTGLVLTGTTFTISDTYQLPQTCLGGQIISWNGAGWSCADAGSGGSGWSLIGNAGTTAGTNFLGTTDNEPLELWVNNLRALLLEPGGASPNIVAGYGGNQVDAGTVGATVGGGGRDLAINQATGNYSVVDGGAGNSAGGYASTVGGGEGNSAQGSYGVAGGGASNAAGGNYAAIGGGQSNVVSSTHAAIGGGQGNVITGPFGTIAGGINNAAYGDYAAVGGGRYNTVDGAYGTIAGGGPADPGNPTTSQNQVIDDYGTIGGGGDNQAGSEESLANYATVGGGQGNTAGASHATVAGGQQNTGSGGYAAIGGGQANVVSGTYAVAGGGLGNSSGGMYAAIGGGRSNTTGQTAATIAGGRANSADGAYSAIGGGYNNQVDAPYGTIPGGVSNHVGGNYGFAAGYQAQAEHQGSFVWSDYSSGAFASTAPDQFLIQAAGGVGIGTESPTELLTVDGSSEILGNGQLTLRSVFTLPGLIMQNPSAVYASGTDIFVTSPDTNTLTIIDASDPGAPRYVAYGTSQLVQPVDVHVVGQRAYVASRDANAIVAFDVSDPAGVADALGDVDWGLAEPVAVYVSGNYAFVASQANDRLAIFNVADPANMIPTTFVTDTLDGPSDVYVSGGYAYVTSRNNNRLVAFDLHPNARSWPKHVGDTAQWLDGPVAVHVRNNHAFVLSTNSNSLVAFDISDKAHITATGRISTTLTRPQSLYVSGEYAYVAFEGDFVTSDNCGLAVFDISDPAQMKVLEVIDMSDSQPEPEKPVGVYGSGNYIYVVNERHWSLAIYEVNHLQAPAATVGTLRAGYLEVNDNALVSNDLVVDGGLNVGQGGAWIGGELSVAGEDSSYILGGLSIGEAAKNRTVTFGGQDHTVLLPYPTHMLDVHGDARFRADEYTNLAIGSRPAGKAVGLDFFPTEQIDEASLTEMITPTARILFDGGQFYTDTATINFYTRGFSDIEAVLRAWFSEDGHLLPNTADIGLDLPDLDLGDALHRWRIVYTKNGVSQLSDVRYKEHLAPLAYGLDEVTALRPVSYNWRDGPVDEVHFGLVAQEVAQVLPELVEGDEADGPLSLNYSELVPVLVSAVQEQQEEIGRQSDQIADLEARLAALEQGGTRASGPDWPKELSIFGIGGLALFAGILLSRRRPGA